MKVPYAIKERRPGDIAICYCDPGKAAKELGWKAENGIKEMCEDSWRWQKNNPSYSVCPAKPDHTCIKE